MTGHEHAQEAERLLLVAGRSNADGANALTAQAQVHAILALAAAAGGDWRDRDAFRPA